MEVEGASYVLELMTCNMVLHTKLRIACDSVHDIDESLLMGGKHIHIQGIDDGWTLEDQLDSQQPTADFRPSTSSRVSMTDRLR